MSITKPLRRQFLKELLAAAAVVVTPSITRAASNRVFDNAASEALPVIFDTDIGNDVDDALALAILHALESRHECRIIAVTITKDNPWCAPYIDLVNTFYGRPDIPIGVVKQSGIAHEDSPMIQVPSNRRHGDGRSVYPHRLLSGNEAPDATRVLRKALARERDTSVKIIQVGFSTNLARLLDSKPDAISPLDGMELARRKVRELCVMAGNFADGKSEYNVHMDVPSFQKVIRDWPTEVVLSGFEIGVAMPFPATSIEHDFAYLTDHPVVEAYRNYQKMPYDRPTWDLTAALYAVRPNNDYFSLSEGGEVTAKEDGTTSFVRHKDGTRRFLRLSQTQRVRTLECMIELASQPPQTLKAMNQMDHK